MKELNTRAFRGIAGVGKAALFCLGILTMLALTVMMAVLMTVMLAATTLPATAVRQRRDPRVRRDSESTPELSAPRKAVAGHDGVDMRIEESRRADSNR